MIAAHRAEVSDAAHFGDGDAAWRREERVVHARDLPVGRMRSRYNEASRGNEKQCEAHR